MPGGGPGDVLGAGGCRAASLPHPLHAGSTPSHENHRHPQVWPSVLRGQNHPLPCVSTQCKMRVAEPVCDQCSLVLSDALWVLER